MLRIVQGEGEDADGWLRKLAAVTAGVLVFGTSWLICVAVVAVVKACK